MNLRAYQDLEQQRAAANRLLVAGKLDGAAARAQVLDAYRAHPDAAARLIDPIDAEPTFAVSETAMQRVMAPTPASQAARRPASFGAYVAQLRAARGLSAWKASHLAGGMSSQDVYRVEAGSRHLGRQRFERLVCA